MEKTKKTYVDDVDRGIYDIKDEMKHTFTTGKGLDEAVVRKISERKKNLNGYLKKD